MAEPEIVRYADGPSLAEAVADRLVATLAAVQATGRDPQLCLTGGRIAGQIYRRLGVDGARAADGSADPGHHRVDWTRVDLWWGDERYVPTDHPDRNDLEALTALAPLGIAPDRIHPMPAAPGSGPGQPAAPGSGPGQPAAPGSGPGQPAQGDDGLDAAAAGYADELGDTVFDVCLLGVGPDGHVASLFPGHPSLTTPGRVIAVRNSPKPPPDRISLTLDVINASAEVWLLVSGDDKAEAVAGAIGGDPDLPATHVAGTRATRWLVDEAAASKIR